MHFSLLWFAFLFDACGLYKILLTTHQTRQRSQLKSSVQKAYCESKMKSTLLKVILKSVNCHRRLFSDDTFRLIYCPHLASFETEMNKNLANVYKWCINRCSWGELGGPVPPPLLKVHNLTKITEKKIKCQKLI